MEQIATTGFPVIPELRPSNGWKELPIKECGEPLICLNGVHLQITVDVQYTKSGIRTASNLQYARLSVAEKLSQAASSLPSRMKLVIWDAWRPLEVQQELFNNYREKLKLEHSQLSFEELTNMTQRYVSLPSSDPAKPSPHYTGGAVDLSILDPNGHPLDMGTSFDHFGPEAAVQFFEENKINITARENRRLLYYTLSEVGFSVYEEEWWHFDFGNQFDGARSNKPVAIYGCISPTTR